MICTNASIIYSGVGQYLTALKYILKPQLKKGNSMHYSFISVSNQTCRPQNAIVIHECQVAKGMRWGILIGGFGGSPPRKFYNSEDPWMRF